MQRLSILMWQLLDLARPEGAASRFTATRGSFSLALARLRLVIAGDHHSPVCALATCILGARNPDAGGILQQQVLAVPGGVDPLAERLLEALVAIGNVLGGAPRTRRRHPPGERAEHLMTELILRRHRSCLVQRNAVEGCITCDANLAMFEAKAGDQFGRRLGGDRRRGQ